MGSNDLLAYNDQEAYVFRTWTSPTGEVTIHVVGSGTESDTDKYFNKGFSGHGYSIVADKDIEIVSMTNGAGNLHKGDPIPVVANVRRTRVLKHPNFVEMVINVLNSDTQIQLEVF